MNRPGPLLAASLAAIVALLIAIGAEWLAGEARLATIDSPPSRPRAAAGKPAVAGETGPTPTQVAGWEKTALARPLMTSSRRPAASSGGPAMSLANGLPRLAGTLVKDGGDVAIFARDDGGKPVIAREGAVLGEYRVLRIVPNAVTLAGPDGNQTLHPRFGTAAATTPSSPLPRPGMVPGMGMAPNGMPLPMTLPGVMGQPQPGLGQQPPDTDPDQDNQ